MKRNQTIPKAVFLAAGTTISLLLALGAMGQVPADDLFSGFLPTGELLFEIDGKVPKDLVVYKSERAQAYLAMASDLASPILLNPRSRSVEQVDLMKIRKRKDGSLDLAADASFQSLGAFKVEGQTIVFDLMGKPAQFKSKPPLLGLHKVSAMKKHKPEYERGAAAYQPDARFVDSLRQVGRDDIRVRVYFGSWCAACTRLVPGILRLHEELGEAAIQFEYYGLPTPLSDDPVAEKLKLNGVPTGIIYQGEKEVGRLIGNQWNRPEASLNAIVKKIK